MAVTLTPYQSLANAIIEQAAFDYRKALKEIKKYGKSEETVGTKRECERFFRSDWFDVLSELDGIYLMKKIIKECA